MERSGNFDSTVVEDRWHQVHVRYQLRAPARSPATTGRNDDQRNVNQLLEHGRSLAPHSMAAQQLSVIGREDDQRVVVEVLLMQSGHEPSHQVVYVAHRPKVAGPHHLQIPVTQVVDGCQDAIGAAFAPRYRTVCSSRLDSGSGMAAGRYLLMNGSGHTKG